MHHQCRRQGGGGNRGSLPRAPSVRGAPNDAGLFQIRSGSLFSSQSRSISLTLLTQTSYIAHFILRDYTAQPLTRALFIVLFDLKPLNEDGNWQVCAVCMHARKGASEVPRTHFRACKIAKFLWGRAPKPPSHNLSCGPYFLYLPRAPTILSAALCIIISHRDNYA